MIKGAFRQRAGVEAAARSGRAAVALVNAQLFAAASEFMKVQLFQLAPRCVAMATAETTVREITLELILLV